jgi:hypothetical protein
MDVDGITFSSLLMLRNDSRKLMLLDLYFEGLLIYYFLMNNFILQTMLWQNVIWAIYVCCVRSCKLPTVIKEWLHK